MKKKHIIYSLSITLLLYLPVQASLATPSNQKTPFETIQLVDMIVVAELSSNDIKNLKDSGKIMPLETIIQQVQDNYPGRIIEIELDEENNAYIYELELVDENSVVWEIEVDATSGKVLKYEQDD